MGNESGHVAAIHCYPLNVAAFYPRAGERLLSDRMSPGIPAGPDDVAPHFARALQRSASNPRSTALTRWASSQPRACSPSRTTTSFRDGTTYTRCLNFPSR